MKLMSKAEKMAHLEARGDLDKYYLNSYDYIAFDSGEVVAIEKPAITSEIWYDDETPDPAKAEGMEALFYRHNMARNWFDFQLTGWQQSRRDLEERGCCCGGWRKLPALAARHNGDFKIETHTEEWSRRIKTTRDLTEEETAELLQIMAQLKAAYEKRLKSYWKRYGDKVHTSGYWAWR
ncbi:MAG: hypothetical protein HFJ72_08420 [Adlercreutzia sp.]|nr:hypothetical protein [Adlercreutzia sp.]